MHNEYGSWKHLPKPLPNGRLLLTVGYTDPKIDPVTILGYTFKFVRKNYVWVS